MSCIDSGVTLHTAGNVVVARRRHLLVRLQIALRVGSPSFFPIRGAGSVQCDPFLGHRCRSHSLT
jgi:hypothetical protein